MLGWLVLLIVLLVVIYLVWRAAQKCHQGDGGWMCKLWHFTA